MKKIVNKQIVFFGGKGGVGKSTSASAFALTSARNGQKTLLVSTDPAHNVGDIFHMKLSGKPQRLTKNLFGIEINPNEETKRYLDGVKDNLKGLVKAKMVEEVHRQIDLAGSSPGADEAAMFDRLVSIILDEKENFDTIVFDTAPTGHTIRLLTLPELMGAWIDGMLKRRENLNKDYSAWMGDGEPVEDPIYDILDKRKERFAEVRKVLLDQELTEYVFVLNAERLPILETEKAVNTLRKHDLLVNTIVINKLLPDVEDSSFLQKRKQQEKEYIKLIDKKFGQQEKIYIPLLDGDVSSLEALDQISSAMKEELLQ
ncbi:ArsA family ATPase [Pseudalkalibacillus salsuginis]|uniref:ArsA family ATPase n=1 Tax=Pseudalkalibacillus salsuginis TaxID=2910972 RepID=UPI001F36B473|nr:ArsA family ATPase [Pseudalkalibacillus salsuginis]MCF6411080.1 ArsA family ATPase [Pseudalkalibacillus salsuginis]